MADANDQRTQTLEELEAFSKKYHEYADVVAQLNEKEEALSFLEEAGASLYYQDYEPYSRYEYLADVMFPYKTKPAFRSDAEWTALINQYRKSFNVEWDKAAAEAFREKLKKIQQYGFEDSWLDEQLKTARASAHSLEYTEMAVRASKELVAKNEAEQANLGAGRQRRLAKQDEISSQRNAEASASGCAGYFAGMFVAFIAVPVLGVILAFAGVELPMSIYVVLMLLCIFGWPIYKGVSTRNKNKEEKAAIQQRYDTSEQRLKQEAENLNKSLDEFKTRYEKAKEDMVPVRTAALERADYVWNKDLVSCGETIQALAKEAFSLHDEVEALGTLPYEPDWPLVDMVITRIKSLKADDIKEALLQLENLDEAAKLRASITGASQNVANAINTLNSDEWKRRIAEFQQREQHFNQEQYQREVQHAQQMEMQAKAVEAEYAKAAAQAATAAAVAAGNAEQKEFHDEIRSQMNR